MGRVARWVRRRFARGALILAYHRVSEVPVDPEFLCVTREHFSEHLAVVQREYNPMRLQELVRAIRVGKVPRGAVVMTFDDGYVDNLRHAKVLLERYETPATVFVTTGYLGQGREFWWDELARIFLEPGFLPEHLQLRMDGTVFQWHLGVSAQYSEATARCHQSWNVLRKDHPTGRQRLYRVLSELLRPLPDAERNRVLVDLRAWGGVPVACRPSHRPLSPEEVGCLVEGGLIEVGAHTVTHPILSRLSGEAQQSEIHDSKTSLEEILGRPVASFAYPYGGRSDYTRETVRIVREAGFACACSTSVNSAGQGSDVFTLPRLVMRDLDGDALAHSLRGWTHG